MQDENPRPHCDCERKIELDCRETERSLCTINGPSIADNFLSSLGSLSSAMPVNRPLIVGARWNFLSIKVSLNLKPKLPPNLKWSFKFWARSQSWKLTYFFIKRKLKVGIFEHTFVLDEIYFRLCLALVSVSNNINIILWHIACGSKKTLSLNEWTDASRVILL